MKQGRLAAITVACGIAFAALAGGGAGVETADAAGSSLQTFMNEAFGRCMSANAESTVLWSCGGNTPDNKWNVDHVDGGVKLQSATEGHCLAADPLRGLTEAACDSGAGSQVFKVKHWNDGTIRFQSRGDGKCIDAYSDGRIATRTCDSSESQSWS